MSSWYSSAKKMDSFRVDVHRVCEIMDGKGLTVKALATRMGCCGRNVYQMIDPEHRLRLRTVRRLADELGVSVSEILLKEERK